MEENLDSNPNWRKCPSCGGVPLVSIPKELPVSFHPGDEKLRVEPWDFRCTQCNEIWKFAELQQIERIENIWHQFGYELKPVKK